MPGETPSTLYRWLKPLINKVYADLSPEAKDLQFQLSYKDALPNDLRILVAGKQFDTIKDLRDNCTTLMQALKAQNIGNLGDQGPMGVAYLFPKPMPQPEVVETI